MPNNTVKSKKTQREQNINNYSNLFINTNNKKKFSNAIHQYNNRQKIFSFGRIIKGVTGIKKTFSQYNNVNIKQILINHLDKFQELIKNGKIQQLKKILNKLIELKIIQKSNDRYRIVVSIDKNDEGKNVVTTLDFDFDRIHFFNLLISKDYFINKYLEIFDKLTKSNNYRREILIFILKNSLLNNNNEDHTKLGITIFLNSFYNLYKVHEEIKKYEGTFKEYKGRKLELYQFLESVNTKYPSIFIDIDKMIKKLKPLPNAKTNNHIKQSINNKKEFSLENYTKSLQKIPNK